MSGNGSEQEHKLIQYVVRLKFPGKNEPFTFGFYAANEFSALGVVVPIISSLMPRIEGYEIFRTEPTELVASCGIAKVSAKIAEPLNKFAPPGGGPAFPMFKIIRPGDMEDADIRKLLTGEQPTK